MWSGHLTLSFNLQIPNYCIIELRLCFMTAGTAGAAPDSNINPGNVALRVRLMSIFCRSITSANSFPSTLQCIFGCIFGKLESLCIMLCCRS